jgi:glycine cleavage system H lipoate-binding protein
LPEELRIMEGLGVDLFGTKGLEYMLVIGYLFLLVTCRRMVGPRRSRSGKDQTLSHTVGSLTFTLREGRYFHQGHTWAADEEDGLMRVGLDDFAQKLVGPVNGLILPKIGAQLGQGEPGWEARVERRSIPILSPVEGEVVAWNEEVLRSPGLVNSEPYDRGWILLVRVHNPAAARRNLLSGRFAQCWMEEVTSALEEHIEEETSVGAGLSRTMSSDAWDRLAREFLMSGGAAVSTSHETVAEPTADQQPQFV